MWHQIVRHSRSVSFGRINLIKFLDSVPIWSYVWMLDKLIVVNISNTTNSWNNQKYGDQQVQQFCHHQIISDMDCRNLTLDLNWGSSSLQPCNIILFERNTFSFYNGWDLQNADCILQHLMSLCNGNSDVGFLGLVVPRWIFKNSSRGTVLWYSADLNCVFEQRVKGFVLIQ